MSNSSEHKLTSITDEVKEFHPLLEKLFHKLPNVTDVEYTHGTDEMGADFVIAKTHETFGHTEYIGVIAKVGKVNQDYSDISRQIEECELSRTFLGGKKKIRITEIWVIITKNITKGAQEKIHEKYKSRKITFIDGSRLGKLVDKYLPNFWTKLPLEIGDYLTKIRLQNNELNSKASLLPILDKDFYIEPEIREFDSFGYNKKIKLLKKKPNKINIFDKIEQQKLIFIEGSMGSGKSKLIRQLIDHFSKSEIYLKKKLIPIFTTYKNLIDKFEGNVDRLIQDSLGEKLIAELEKPSCLVLIDAVDEKDLPSDVQVQTLTTLINHIMSLENVKVIITSRYLKEFDKTNNLNGNICICEIQPLTINKTIEFFKAVCTKLNITSRILEDLKKSQLYKELHGSPIAVILLAKLLQENTQDLPSNMTELYSKFIELTLGRWDIEKGLQSQKEYQVLDNIMMQIAKYMVTNEMPSISVDEAKQMFKNYLNTRNLDINVEKLFDKMLSRCEIILYNEESYTLSFKHRTFAEFFYAKLLSDGRRLEINDKAFEPYWMNTFFFYLGILKDCPAILAQIYEIEPDSEPKRWLKFANMGNYFLAAYASTYEVITQGLIKVMLDGAKLYKAIVECKIDSLFSEWPRMHVLFFLQVLSRQGYSYDFLKKAIESAALEIDEKDIEEELKAYSIFFLNVAYIDASSDESLDFLLKERVGRLPLDLTLAIRHESESIKNLSTLMKKQERYFKKIVKGNKSLITQIEKLYEKPVKLLVQNT